MLVAARLQTYSDESSENKAKKHSCHSSWKQGRGGISEIARVCSMYSVSKSQIAVTSRTLRSKNTEIETVAYVTKNDTKTNNTALQLSPPWTRSRYSVVQTYIFKSSYTAKRRRGKKKKKKKRKIRCTHTHKKFHELSGPRPSALVRVRSRHIIVGLWNRGSFTRNLVPAGLVCGVGYLSLALSGSTVLSSRAE